MYTTKNKGITLIALIITIIILLILAGISLAELTGHGLFAQAQRAKLETKRSTITEWLSIKLIEEQTNNPSGTAEEIIEATRENVINNQNELEKMGKDINIEEISNEENGKYVEAYFYVIVDEDVYKVELEGVKFVGRKDEFLPIIKITRVTNTTNTITVTVETQRNEGGKIEYWIEAEDEEEYRKIGETEGEEKSYTYEGLTQNKKYSIKVIAIAKNKKTAEATAEKITGNLPDLTEADIEFIYTPKEWTNGNVEVTASANIDITGYTLQTSKDGKTWTNTASQTFTANGTIYARLYDGTNYGGTAAGNVTNIDKTKPVVTGATSTTNSIKITATDEASGIIGYAVTTSNTAPTSFTSCTSTKTLSTTVSKKTQGTTYYVWVKDAAGNVSASKSTTTGTVTDLTTANVTFTYTPAQGTWTNGNVTATASTTVTGYTLQTSKDGKTWTNTASQTFTANGTIYARLYDGTNYGGTAAGNVTNIDKTKPTIGTVTGSTTTANIGTVTVTGISDTGGSGISGYYVSSNSTKPTETSVTWITLSGSSFTWNTTVNGNGTYYVWVKDKAGNISDAKSCTVSGLVSKVTITAYNNLTIVAGNTGTPTLTKTGTGKSTTYSSSDTAVATINASTGAVTGIKTGTATMTVKITNYDGTTVSKSCTVTVQAAVAQVGSTNYASIEDAISAISSSGTIKLLVNTTESPTFPAEKTITFDLNGKILTGTVTNKGKLITNAGTINNNTDKAIKNDGNGELTINGTIVSSSGSYTIYNYDNATLTISSGTIRGTSADYGTIANKNKLNINGGTIYSQYRQAIYTKSKGTTTIAGSSTKISSDADGYGTCTGEEGCKYIVKEGTIYSKSKNVFNILKSSSLIIYGGNIYTNSGGTICVYGENSVYGNVTMSGGKVWSNSDSSHNTILVEGGKFTITGGTVTCKSKSQEAIDIEKDGIANIQGGTVENTAGGRAIIVGDSTSGEGTLAVTGGTITNTSTEANYATVRVNNTYGNFTFTKGTIKNGNSSGYCYYKNKDNNKTGTWTK